MVHRRGTRITPNEATQAVVTTVAAEPQAIRLGTASRVNLRRAHGVRRRHGAWQTGNYSKNAMHGQT
jgi:hypothetical protein